MKRARLQKEGSRKKPRLLLVQLSANFDGSAVSGRLVAKALLGAGWTVDVVFGFDGPYAAEYEAIGCRTHVLEHRSWLRGGNALRFVRHCCSELVAARRFVRLIRSLDIDLVYVNSLVSLAAAIGARLSGRPCVWHLRELFNDVGGEMRVPALGGKRLVRHMIERLPNSLVAISAAVRDNVVGNSTRVHTEIVPNAVPAEFFSIQLSPDVCREKLLLPRGVPLVGVPGTLRPMKGHPFLLDAVSKVISKLPACQFAITGDGHAAYRDELFQIVERDGVKQHVHFLGTVQCMPEFYRACDIVCVPSKAEPFGRTVIEAFAMGVPLIASNVGGIRESVDHGTTGMLVEFGDIERLAHEMVSLLTNEPLRHSLATAARKKAEQEYHESIYEQRIMAIVDRVVGPSSPQPGKHSPRRATSVAS